MLFSINDNELILGNYVIKYINNHFHVYNVKSDELICNDLYLIESAILIGKYCHEQNYIEAKRVYNLDTAYAKYYNDITGYKHNALSAEHAAEYYRLNTIEIRINEATIKLHEVKQCIRKMCEYIVKKR